MSTHLIKMPDIGEGIAEVELVAWHVKPGDAVIEDQALADVMTDKANVEIPSPVAGIVLSLGGDVGQTLAVGSELIRIEVADIGKAPAQSMPDKSSGPVEPTTPARPAAPRSPTSPHDHPIASPAIRRRAWELGLELNDVPGTGLGGRIMQADLDTAAARRGSAAARPDAHATPTGVARQDEQTIPVIGVRRKIAQKMQESKRRIPHFTYVEEIDVTELEALRAQLNDEHGKERGRLTVLPFLMRAVVLAVPSFPQMNARFDDEKGIVTR